MVEGALSGKRRVKSGPHLRPHRHNQVQKSMQIPFLSQSPKRVGSGPFGPPVSFTLAPGEAVGLLPRSLSRGSALAGGF